MTGWLNLIEKQFDEKRFEKLFFIPAGDI